VGKGGAVREGGGVAQNEIEFWVGVPEAVIADGEPVHDILRDVIEKDQPQRDTTEQIEPQVASARRQRRSGRRCRCHCESGQYEMLHSRLHDRLRRGAWPGAIKRGAWPWPANNES